MSRLVRSLHVVGSATCSVWYPLLLPVIGQGDAGSSARPKEKLCDHRKTAAGLMIGRRCIQQAVMSLSETSVRRRPAKVVSLL